MTTMQLARRAVRLFNNNMVAKHVNRHNQRSWINAVRELGDKWVFINYLPKATTK
jgi:hypothetical protein